MEHTEENEIDLIFYYLILNLFFSVLVPPHTHTLKTCQFQYYPTTLKYSFATRVCLTNAS